MKILKVNYMEGEARFVIEGFPKQCFIVPLEGKTTKAEVVAQLLMEIPIPDTTKEKYDNLKIASLEGSDI